MLKYRAFSPNLLLCSQDDTVSLWPGTGTGSRPHSSGLHTVPQWLLFLPQTPEKEGEQNFLGHVKFYWYV